MNRFPWRPVSGVEKHNMFSLNNVSRGTTDSKLRLKVLGIAFICIYYEQARAWYKSKAHKAEVFTIVTIWIEKQVSEVRKKWETNVWNLELGEKWQVHFFSCVIVPLKVDFLYRCKQNLYKDEFFKLISIKFENFISEVQKI